MKTFNELLEKYKSLKREFKNLCDSMLEWEELKGPPKKSYITVGGGNNTSSTPEVFTEFMDESERKQRELVEELKEVKQEISVFLWNLDPMSERIVVRKLFLEREWGEIATEFDKSIATIKRKYRESIAFLSKEVQVVDI